MITSFADVWAKVALAEGDRLSMDPNDPGNWTGGAVGAGQLRGSKYGISAASFPNEDIAAMSYDRAMGIAKTKYWDPYKCDQFSPIIGYLIFDAAFNGGYPARWLQQAVSVTVDGDIGAQTIAAVRARPVSVVVMRFMAARFDYWTSCSAWPSQGKGWVHRGTEIMRTVSDYL